MATRAHWLRTWGPAMGYMVLIWVLSSIPKQLDITRVLWDKGVHFLEYAVLAVLLAHALRGTWWNARVLLVFFGAAFATTLWGAIDEIHQGFVPNRVPDVGDLIADSIGALFGAALYLLVRQRRALTPP